jgi:hypothetical protein
MVNSACDLEQNHYRCDFSSMRDFHELLGSIMTDNNSRMS